METAIEAEKHSHIRDMSGLAFHHRKGLAKEPLPKGFPIPRNGQWIWHFLVWRGRCCRVGISRRSRSGPDGHQESVAQRIGKTGRKEGAKRQREEMLGARQPSWDRYVGGMKTFRGVETGNYLESAQRGSHVPRNPFSRSQAIR